MKVTETEKVSGRRKGPRKQITNAKKGGERKSLGEGKVMVTGGGVHRGRGGGEEKSLGGLHPGKGSTEEYLLVSRKVSHRAREGPEQPPISG